jgi:hypothetical protein
MIFTSESGLTDPGRLADWDAWYLGHLAAMAAVPGIASAQRFRALTGNVPPSLAMYTVASPAVFDSEAYRLTRGMGPFVSVVDERLHRRNLFAGLDVAPEIPISGILLVADRPDSGPAAPGLAWLRAVGLDHSTAWRGIAACRDRAAAHELAGRIGGAALYAATTERFAPTGGG